MRRRLPLVGTAVLGIVVVASATLPVGVAAGPADDGVADCTPGGAAVEFAGGATQANDRSYEALPFDVMPGTTRVELTYGWVDRPLAPGVELPSTPVTQTVFDLGLWDNHGLGAADGFRGWSGSRAGRVATGQPPVFVQQDVAQRGYRPAPIEPGRWWADLGIAAVGPTGADWSVTVTCSAPDVGAPFVSTPVDPTHVADPEPGWRHGDFHMHGFHSNLRAPSWDGFVEQARAENLDVLTVTDYVTGQHWDELGPVQEANPDLLIWPGREIITYFGHANTHGETRSVLDYRHGFPGVSLADIQRAAVADGALFQVNHPTIFPGPVFRNFCRGCEFELGSVIDWDLVTTIEVVTGPVLAAPDDLGLPAVPGLVIQQPFVITAIELWESLLQEGHRITAVSGSDSKGVDSPERRERVGYGSSATAIYSSELSRAGISAALRAGHAYVRTRGVDESPAVEFTGVAPDGSAAMFGDTLVAESATLTVVVRGGMSQLLQVTRNGLPHGLPVLIDADPFTYTFAAARDRSGEGPLGTFFRVDTFDLLSLTTIGNPIFLADQAASGPSGPSGPTGAPSTAAARNASLPATGTGELTALVGGALLGMAILLRRRTHVR